MLSRVLRQTVPFVAKGLQNSGIKSTACEVAFRNFSQNSKIVRQQPLESIKIVCKRPPLPSSTPPAVVSNLEEMARKNLDSNLSRACLFIDCMPEGSAKDTFIQSVLDEVFVKCKEFYDEDTYCSQATLFDWYITSLIRDVSDDAVRKSAVEIYSKKIRDLQKQEEDPGFEKVLQALEKCSLSKVRDEIETLGDKLLDTGDYDQYIEALQVESRLSNEEKEEVAKAFVLKMAKTAQLRWTFQSAEQISKSISPDGVISPTGAIPTIFSTKQFLKKMPGSNESKKAIAEEILGVFKERNLKKEEMKIFEDYIAEVNQLNTPASSFQDNTFSFFQSIFSKKS